MHYVVYFNTIISKYNIYYFLQKANNKNEKKQGKIKEKKRKKNRKKNCEIYFNICFRMVFIHYFAYIFMNIIYKFMVFSRCMLSHSASQESNGVAYIIGKDPIQIITISDECQPDGRHISVWSFNQCSLIASLFPIQPGRLFGHKMPRCSLYKYK